MDVPEYLHAQVMDILACELDAACRKGSWSVLLRPKLEKYGPADWMVSWGGEEGPVVGTGSTPEQALLAFDVAMTKSSGEHDYGSKEKG